MATKREIWEERRELVRLCVTQGKSRKQTAAELQLPVKTVSNIIYNLRAMGKVPRPPKAVRVNAPKAVDYTGATVRPPVSGRVEVLRVVKCPHCGTTIMLNGER